MNRHAGSVRELAEAVGRSRSAVHRATLRGDFPARDHAGRWNVADALGWFARREREQLGADDDRTTARALRARRLELEAARLRLEIGIARGELLPRAAFIADLRERAGAASRLFRSRARRLAEKCANRSAAEVFALLHADAGFMAEVYSRAPVLGDVRDPDAEGEADDDPADDGSPA